jgi:hypothetical protein
MPAAAVPELCRGGRPVGQVTASFARRVPDAGPGLPLDEALAREETAVASIREDAKRYFLEHRHETLDRLRARYTFLIPDAVKERLGLGTLYFTSRISEALRYRSYLWKQYIERYTKVEEAPSRDPYTLRFKVALDLAVFCQYRQLTDDLVTQR